MFAGGLLTYNFSDTVTKAFGSNMPQVDFTPVIFALYSGDVDQNGLINLSDVITIYNDANIFITGFEVTDINGDNIIDLTDVIIASNNSSNFVGKITP